MMLAPHSLSGADEVNVNPVEPFHLEKSGTRA
jgi:hypothetical protein